MAREPVGPTQDHAPQRNDGQRRSQGPHPRRPRQPAGSVTLQLSLTADEMLKLYSGSAREVVARAEDGQTVRFPADILRPFVTHGGVQGRFRIRYDTAGRFAGIERL